MFVSLSCLPGSGAPLVICSDCYDNANIYSRTREYCPYAYITEEDPLEQTLPNLMVQMPKETYSARTQREASALDTILTDRDMSVFLTNHDKISEKKIPSQQMNGECPRFLCGFVFPSSSAFCSGHAAHSSGDCGWWSGCSVLQLLLELVFSSHSIPKSGSWCY